MQLCKFAAGLSRLLKGMQGHWAGVAQNKNAVFKQADHGRFAVLGFWQRFVKSL